MIPDEHSRPSKRFRSLRSLGWIPVLLILVGVQGSAGPRLSFTVDRVFPEDCLVSIEITGPRAVLKAFARAGGLFPGRPDHPRTVPSVVGDQVVWVPAGPVASALIYSLDLPYRKGGGPALGKLLRSTEGWAAFSLMPRGRLGAVGVLALALARADVPPRMPEGYWHAYANGLLVLSTCPDAVRTVEKRIMGLGRARGTPATGPRCRIRVRLQELLRRRPRAGKPVLDILKHYVPWLPETVEVTWQGGREEIRFPVGDLSSILEPEGPRGLPRIPNTLFQIEGRIALPEGLEGLQKPLARNPFGLRALLARSWPGDPPDLLTLARHCTGRFALIGHRHSNTIVPVVGLEVRNPDRTLTLLENRLLATGTCDRMDQKPVPYTFPRHVPDSLRFSMLFQQLRNMINAVRAYQVALAFGWVWLGPESDVRSILRSLERQEDFTAGPGTMAPSPPGPGNPGSPVLGRVDLNVSALWNEFLMLEWVDASSLHLSAIEEDLKQDTMNLARAWGRLCFTVSRDGRALVLKRRVPLSRSLLTLLAARGFTFHETVSALEHYVRHKVRGELQILFRDQQAYQKLKGRHADSTAQLVEAGLWAPGTPETGKVWEAYILGVVKRVERGNRTRPSTHSGRFALFAIPRSSGPAGWRPAYLIREDGRIFVGEAPSRSLEVLPEDLKAAGWRPVPVGEKER